MGNLCVVLLFNGVFVYKACSFSMNSCLNDGLEMNYVNSQLLRVVGSLEFLL